MLRLSKSYSSLARSVMTSHPRTPLVAILGATGTGKSELAVKLAVHFNGEVINADAMQLYHGLPIITNKITEHDMQGIRHHLLGRIGLEQQTWTVGKFVQEALLVIDEIRARGKLPILVGGTHYYTQSLIFKDALAKDPVANDSDLSVKDFPILGEPTEVLVEKLEEIDPVMANRWHPNERRKIQRSLEIYLKTGKPASQFYEEQRIARDSASAPDCIGQALRFPTLLLWVHAKKEVLHRRLDSRILKMLHLGLLSEVISLTSFREEYETETGRKIDQTRGIWGSIGYKEFLEYQSALQSNFAKVSDLEKLKLRAVERTQAATRQYANRQIRWIRIKLINALVAAGEKDRLFLLDGTDLTAWDRGPVSDAFSLTSTFLCGHSLPIPSHMSELANEMLIPKRDYDLGQRPDLWQKRTCEVCGMVAVTENDWNLHIKSRGHRRLLGAKKKKENAQKQCNRDKTVQADLVDVLETYLNTFDSDPESPKGTPGSPK